MTNDHLTAILAERVMGWRAAPGRYMMGGRGWKPDWRFQPTKRLEDAFSLLDAADPAEYSITASRGGVFTVSVRVDRTLGKASDTSKPRAITYAVARAIGLDPEGRQGPKTGVEGR